MKWLWNDKDGGPESLVWGWGFESKRFGSILLLKFGRGSREAFHTHAFNSVSWVLRGRLLEWFRHGIHSCGRYHEAGIFPVRTYRETFHKVEGMEDATWALTFRGPWVDTWKEHHPLTGRNIRLTHGRKEL